MLSLMLIIPCKHNAACVHLDFKRCILLMPDETSCHRDHKVLKCAPGDNNRESCRQPLLCNCL